MPPSTDLPIQSFLDSLRTTGTASAYRTGVVSYLDFLFGRQREGVGATKEEFKHYEELAHQYLTSNLNKTPDITKWIKKMGTDKVPPKTISIRLCGVREWLIHHGVEFSQKETRDIRKVKPKGGRRTDFKYANSQILRDVINHSDIRLKALVLVLASSGCRISEALNLTLSDVHIPDRTRQGEKERLTSLYISEPKTGISRTTWITREAEEALLEWLKIRTAYLAVASVKTKNIGFDKTTDDKRVFPFTRSPVYHMWDRALKATGHYELDSRTDRNRLNVHRLRGYFKTQTMGIVGPDLSELMLGHSDQYGNAYRNVGPEALEEAYRKCEDALTIATAHGAERKMAAYADDLKKSKQTVEDLQERLSEVESRRTLTEESALLVIERLLLKLPKPQLDEIRAAGLPPAPK